MDDLPHVYIKDIAESGPHQVIEDSVLMPDLLADVMLGLYAKCLSDLWSVIVLSERTLPAAASFRELIEAVINMSYIAADDSRERAQLYWDSQFVQREKYASRLREVRSNGPISIMVLSTKISEIESRRGRDELHRMRNWRTWSGRSVKDMADAIGMPPDVYLDYLEVCSRIHATDAVVWALRESREVLDTPEKPPVELAVIRPQVGQPPDYLGHACWYMVQAMSALDRVHGGAGSDQVESLGKEVETALAKWSEFDHEILPIVQGGDRKE
jgi:hypothetical protein